MGFKRKRAKTGRISGRGRRFARRARSIFSKPTRFLGFKPDGFHVSDAIIAGGLVAPAFIAVSNALPESSPVGCLMGRGIYANYTLEQKIRNALELYCVQTLGVNFKGSSVGYDVRGIGGMAVGAGVAMKLAGRVINPVALRGAAVKL